MGEFAFFLQERGVKMRTNSIGMIAAGAVFILMSAAPLSAAEPSSKTAPSMKESVLAWNLTNARVVSDVAEQIGIPVRDMIVEERPSDTVEEARLLRGLLGSTPFVLVTSAAHMKRAVRIFQGFGMQPVPAPTDFIIKNKPGGASDSWLPNCGNLWISQRVIYEWFGEKWEWIKP